MVEALLTYLYLSTREIPTLLVLFFIPILSNPSPRQYLHFPLSCQTPTHPPYSHYSPHSIYSSPISVLIDKCEKSHTLHHLILSSNFPTVPLLWASILHSFPLFLSPCTQSSHGNQAPFPRISCSIPLQQHP